ncbi:hypothetical protein EKO04_010861 [Ascochyta lentis]|uniref:Uncharacterized protein n=1 Tax=Ascochyta lentis TaxID=205686 RepID=A0A8H7IUB2_9PLEO|nr:hypothetical protein EKO04_010861 [Ascochyta lentis]
MQCVAHQEQKASFIVHQPGNSKHLLQDDQNSTISFGYNASHILKNLKHRYKVPETAMALFGSDTHVYDSSDDIKRSYDLVLTISLVNNQAKQVRRQDLT